MILKRPIHILLVRGDHGDAAFTCEEFMIGGEYMWDDPETERSFVRELFNAYDSPDVYKYDNYVQFRALIKEVQRIPVM